MVVFYEIRLWKILYKLYNGIKNIYGDDGLALFFRP